MTETTAYQRHIADMLGRGQALAQQVVEQTQQALRASSTDIALANDRQLLFQVAQAVHQHRSAWATQMASGLHAEATAVTQDTALQPKASAPVSLSELTLVDEAQAEQAIEISRTVQLIDLAAEWELRELNAMSMALQGQTQLRGDQHPFQPAVYARALSSAVASLKLPLPEHHMLLRVSGREMAKLLQAMFGQVCQSLRQQGHQALPYQAPKVPRPPPPSSVNVTQPGALDSVRQRLAVEGRDMPTASAPAQSAQLVTRLFAQMAADETLPEPLKALMATLQPAMVTLAQHDPHLLRTDQHPAWRLVNELSSQACGYAETDLAGLNALAAYMQPRLSAITDSQGHERAPFEQALRDALNFIARHSQRDLSHSQPALAELQVADHRLSLRPILQQQVEQQLSGTRISSRIAQFLTGPWVDVITHAMAHGSEDGDEAQAMLCTVDDLLQSLTRPSTLAERDALRHMLPDLIPRLQHGMRLIALPAQAQEAVLDELMATHSRYLRATPRPSTPPAELTPQELVQRMRDEMAADSQCSSVTTQTPIERPIDTSVGSLPTVPMRYESDALGTAHSEAPAQTQAWLDSLDAGQWCKLCLRGQWTTAHLMWISANRRFFMFSSKGEQTLHPMGSLALQRLRAAGLAASLQERSAMQRAVDSLLQNLDD